MDFKHSCRFSVNRAGYAKTMPFLLFVLTYVNFVYFNMIIITTIIICVLLLLKVFVTYSDVDFHWKVALRPFEKIISILSF